MGKLDYIAFAKGGPKAKDYHNIIERQKNKFLAYQQLNPISKKSLDGIVKNWNNFLFLLAKDEGIQAKVLDIVQTTLNNNEIGIEEVLKALNLVFTSGHLDEKGNVVGANITKSKVAKLTIGQLQDDLKKIEQKKFMIRNKMANATLTEKNFYSASQDIANLLNQIKKHIGKYDSSKLLIDTVDSEETSELYNKIIQLYAANTIAYVDNRLAGLIYEVVFPAAQFISQNIQDISQQVANAVVGNQKAFTISNFRAEDDLSKAGYHAISPTSDKYSQVVIDKVSQQKTDVRLSINCSDYIKASLKNTTRNRVALQGMGLYSNSITTPMYRVMADNIFLTDFNTVFLRYLFHQPSNKETKALNYERNIEIKVAWGTGRLSEINTLVLKGLTFLAFRGNYFENEANANVMFNYHRNTNRLSYITENQFAKAVFNSSIFDFKKSFTASYGFVDRILSSDSDTLTFYKYYVLSVNNFNDMKCGARIKDYENLFAKASTYPIS